MIEIKDIGDENNINLYLRPYEGSTNLTATDFERNRVWVRVTNQEGVINTWALQSQDEFNLIYSALQSTNKQGLHGSNEIQLKILTNECTNKRLNPTRKAHKGDRVDLLAVHKGIAEKAKQKTPQQLSEKTELISQEISMDVLAVLKFLSNMDEGSKQSVRYSETEQLKNDALVSIFFMDAAFWQLAGDLVGAQASRQFKFFGLTGAAAGGYVAISHMAVDLACELYHVKRGEKSLADALKIVFGNGVLYGVACTLSNAVWQMGVNLATPETGENAGQTDEKAYVYTATLCTGIFLTALTSMLFAYRVSGANNQPKEFDKRMTLFGTDLRDNAWLTGKIAVAAASFCLTLFDKVLGIPNAFKVVTPKTLGDYLLNMVKAAGSNEVGFGLVTAVQQTVKSIRGRGTLVTEAVVNKASNPPRHTV